MRLGTVDVGLSAWMALGSVPAAIGGVAALSALERATGHRFNSILLAVLAAPILLTGFVTLARALFLRGLVDREREQFRLDRRHKAAAIIIGAFVGFMRGVTSAGSGALIALFRGSGLGLATKAGLRVPGAAIAAVPAVVAALALAPWLRARRARARVLDPESVPAPPLAD